MADFCDLANRAFDGGSDNPLRDTQALIVAIDGHVVVERYADGFDHKSTFVSWSIAKSVLAALCGVLVGDGRLDLDQPAAVPEWKRDGRSRITPRQLLQMRSGLTWNEDYIDDRASDVIAMLFGSGADDVAGYSAKKSLSHKPGEHFCYSSGTSNIVSRLCGDIIGGGPAGFEAALIGGLLVPAGMSAVTTRQDLAGTWVGSSYLYATARDFLAFGELYRNDGMVGGARLLPVGWVDECTTEQSFDADSGQGYGLHWWTVRGAPESYAANGYEGQRVQVTPELGLTFVRLGKTPADRSDDLRAFYASIVEAAAG